MKWFRFYSEVLNDPKVQSLSAADFKAWVNLLCVASEQEPRGSLPAEDIAFALRMSVTSANRLISRFTEKGFLDVRCDTVTGVFIHGWAKRQYDSDDTTKRTRKHRSLEQNGNVPVTPPDTDTEYRD